MAEQMDCNPTATARFHEMYVQVSKKAKEFIFL